MADYPVSIDRVRRKLLDLRDAIGQTGKTVLNMALSQLEGFPPMDVVHGEWLRENIRPKSYMRVCSLCKKTAYFCAGGCSYRYCPYCGQPMEVETDG